MILIEFNQSVFPFDEYALETRCFSSPVTHSVVAARKICFNVIVWRDLFNINENLS